VNAIGSIIDGQLNAWQQRNSFLLGGLAKSLELIEVELVVIGDDAQPDACSLQRINVVAVVEVFISRVPELSIRTGMQMKVCTHPLGALDEGGSSSSWLL
jgi:hypothetical protein